MKSDWQNGKEERVEWKGWLVISLLFFCSPSLSSPDKIIELLCYSDAVGTLGTSALSWDVVHLRKQTMVCSDQ